MIKIGIAGYGNLGKGVEKAVADSPDMELTAVFTRRSPDTVKIKTVGTIVESFNNINMYRDKIDVVINCGGSATDLPLTTPQIAKSFNVVDSFDNHSEIEKHRKTVNAHAVSGGRIAIVSVGWDPGLFSLARAYSQAVLPQGHTYTFWGRGVSQGHSDAIRRIDGVVDARQYTVPVSSAIEKIKSGESSNFSPREMHKRECYVVAEDGANKSEIEKKIKSMPAYFADYDTTVSFISEKELTEKHSALPHGGMVVRNGITDSQAETKHSIEFSLKLASNPEFTGSVLTAYARAAYRLYKSGEVGCKTVLDIAPTMLFRDETEINRLI